MKVGALFNAEPTRRMFLEEHIEIPCWIFNTDVTLFKYGGFEPVAVLASNGQLR